MKVNQVVVSIFLLLGLVQVTVAGPKPETLDVTTFTPPSGWKRTAANDTIQFSVSKGNAAGSIAIVRSIPAVGDARANFDKAWEQLVAVVASDAPVATLAPASTRDGWQVVRGTATYSYEGHDTTTVVFTATRDANYVIALATTVGTTYKKDVDKFFASLRFSAPAGGSAPPPAAPTSATSTELSGAWGFSTGGALNRGTSKAWLSDRREYAFDGKGSYTFLRRFNIDHDPDTSLIRERGTYSLAGDVLTLTPTKSEREIWSKGTSGPTAGKYIKLLKRENVALEKATYRVEYTLYPGTQVPNLMLTPSAATQRDGTFNATAQYRLFHPDGQYYTAVPPTP